MEILGCESGTSLAIANVAAIPESEMTLKIERILDGEYIALRLSGRLCSEHLAELKSLIADSSPAVVLDLDEITQVDVGAINFLRKYQAEGIELRHCSPYICEWMDREQDSERRRSL
jgi:ABC-type transporter Mla MlaB component